MAGKDDKPTTSQVRKGKHTRRPGEPVVENEPAASPLGTDDEAAGRPPEPERVKSAVDNDPVTGGEPHEIDRHAPRPSLMAWVAVAAVAAFAALILAALMLS